MENTRICTKCKVIKPFSEFYWHKEYNIPFSRCKKCYNENCKKYRYSKKGKKTYKKWIESQRGRDVRSKAMEKWEENNKIKHSAVTAVGNAVRDGRLIKPATCSTCFSSENIEAHHTSYEEKCWLNVMWLCKKCHTSLHYKK